MINKVIRSIWIEAEEWAEGEWTPEDDNTDVIVTDESGKRWVATFFTYKNILSLSERNKAAGECLGGTYFWASNMILVDEVTRARIDSVVLALIESGEFESTFSVIEED